MHGEIEAQRVKRVGLGNHAVLAVFALGLLITKQIPMILYNR